MNGIQNYELLFNNTYKEEKQQKLNFIEKLRNYKDILQKYKFKRTELETDIAYSNESTLKTFLAMCAIENKNVCVLKGRCLYTLIVNDTSLILLQWIIIDMDVTLGKGKQHYLMNIPRNIG